MLKKKAHSPRYKYQTFQKKWTNPCFCTPTHFLTNPEFFAHPWTRPYLSSQCRSEIGTQELNQLQDILRPWRKLAFWMAYFGTRCRFTNMFLFSLYSLKRTAREFAPENRPFNAPKRKRSSNHRFSGAMLVSGRLYVSKSSEKNWLDPKCCTLQLYVRIV